MEIRVMLKGINWMTSVVCIVLQFLEILFFHHFDCEQKNFEGQEQQR
jgi:hypothetical protein